MDKFEEWTHPRNTVPDKIIDRDRLLANASVYWFTRTAGSAAFIGYGQGSNWTTPHTNSGIPTAAIAFGQDVSIRRHAEEQNTVTRWTDVDDRGHFPAMEEPDVLTADFGLLPGVPLMTVVVDAGLVRPSGLTAKRV
jgi:epoxide hydrolase